MSLKLPSAPGAQLFKPGYQTYQTDDGAVSRNVTACAEIASIVRTSIGPCGRNKIIVNHLQKVFVTSDAATILRELDVVHPAAKLLVMANQQQEMEMGDGTNLVIVLAGELLNKAQDLITLGLHPSQIIKGYEIASQFALKTIDDLTVEKVTNIRSQRELAKAVKTVIGAKQYGEEEFLSDLVAEAVLHVLPANPANFNIDNIRVVKVMGSTLSASKVVKGMVFGREPEGSVKMVKHGKVAVFSCPIDISQTETSGTVLLHNAKEILDFSKGEEHQLEAAFKELADAGVKVVVAGASIGELALHYLNRFGILVIRVTSKFDLRRLSRVVGATPLPRLEAPGPEEMGSIDVVETVEIGGDRVTVFRQEGETTRTATIVLRGATQNSLDDIERAIDDGVNVIKSLALDGRMVPGAGATEAELVLRVAAHGDRTPGILQHAIRKFGEAFEVVPRTLIENAGLSPTEILTKLYSAHTNADNWNAGVDVEEKTESGLVDAEEEGILDLLSSKRSAIRLATDAATTILSVDQIVMAKRAGGPAMPSQPQQGNWDQAD